jgi:uncharacterized RDD family membrane protein YckC
VSTTDRAPARTVATIPAEARSFQGEPSGIVTRLLANAIDAAAAAAIVVGVYLVVAAIQFLRRGVAFRFPTVTSAQAYVAFALVLTGYFAWSWATTGRTYGDALLGLRVITRDGHRLRPGRALVRAVLCVAFPMLLLWAAISRDSHSVQDLVMRTSVRYDWGPGRLDLGDPGRVAVDVAAPVADEPDDGHPEPLPRLDGE